MNVRAVVLASILGIVLAGNLAAQTPVLGNLEAPYPAMQSPVHVAGASYGPGSVAYGPVGTPLVLTGTNLGTNGTVQFIGYKNGSVDPGTTVQAAVTMWSSTMVFFTVPSGAVSGMITVTVNGKGSSNALPFIVTPGAYSGSCPASPPNNQLQITTSSLPSGDATQTYSTTLQASGGSGALTWSLVAGSFPTGLSLNSSSGTISGTPGSAAGPMDLTFQVTDSSSPPKSDQTVLSLTISQTLTPATIYTYAVPSGGFDGVGNVTQLQDSIMGNWGYSYDTLNRLVTGTPTSGFFNGQYACWSYDPFGNRTSESLSSTTCANSPPLLSWAHYNVSNTNRMDATSLNPNQQNDYDAAGNITDDGVVTYVYDAEGRVCAVENEAIPGTPTMIGYLYDADGIRVAKGAITTMSCDPGTNGFQLTESYVLGPGGEELTMLDGNNNWQRTNVSGAGKLLATYDSLGLHFHISDPLGTRRLQTSAVGQPETDVQSLPFGDQLTTSPDPNAPTNPATADDATPLHYTGKERDTESGNDYFGARYYASSMGRFLSPDWSAKVEPVPYAKLDDPQSLNLYSYVRDNPLSRIDQTGHDGDDGCCVADPEEATAAAAEGEDGVIVLDIPGLGAIVGAAYVIDKLVNPPTVYTGDLPTDKNGNPIVPPNTLAPKPNPTPTDTQVNNPNAASHRRNRTRKNWDKHTDPRPGRKNTKDRLNPNWRPFRDFKKPKPKPTPPPPPPPPPPDKQNGGA